MKIHERDDAYVAHSTYGVDVGAIVGYTISGSALHLRGRIECYSVPTLTTDGHVFGWKDFNDSVLACFFLNISIARAFYLEDTNLAARKVL